MANKVTRRKFLSIAAGAIASAALPSSAKAHDAEKMAETIKTQNKGNIPTERIISMYDHSESFEQGLTQEQKARFEQFNRAYTRAMDANPENPAVNVFIPQRGKITMEYQKHYPWINLNKPTYDDRKLIFENEVINAGSRGRRIDWRFVRREGSQHRFGDRDGPDHIRKDGELYERQGDGNIYISTTNKKHIIARD